MPVTGIGGLFFRARDPKGLAAWYRQHLGVDAGDDRVWRQDQGPTVFAPFPADSDYFPTDKQWMLNLRVRDIEAMIASLQAAGVKVITDPGWDSSGFGRFARIYDPEGNPIELWEPPG